MLDQAKIILGVTGSIAAYKAVYLLRLLKKAGADVRVVTTASVDEFVGELTFSSLSGHSVFSGLWEEEWSQHVELGTWADLMVVAPATAHTLAKFAHGLCDNALTAVYLAARCPVMVAPAMDVDMFLHPRTAANLQQLSQDGVEVLPSGTGFLASGLEGPGRLLEPEEIFAHIQQRLLDRPLRGKKVLITAGPTREAIDPVRFLSNHSSGKMGYALAEVAAQLGAEVVLVSGPTSLSTPSQVQKVKVVSAQEMYEAVHECVDRMDIVIMAAAVSDYTPEEVATEKMKKKEGDMAIALKRTKDILKSVGKIKKPDQTLVGFAMETQNELENAKNKLVSKNLDFVVLNSLRDPGAGFGHETNKVSILDRQGGIAQFPLKPKKEVAKDIFQKIVAGIERQSG
ncbi:MAG: bifunctional phosphopantothenoylcysteine decarboxylase/phosphopantothenate--cysteine ligase CoaBC [Bacteroidota bacterium]